MTTLNDDIEMFSNEIIRLMIDFLWSYYFWAIVIIEFIPFLLLMIFVLVYTMYLYFAEIGRTDLIPELWDSVSWM